MEIPLQNFYVNVNWNGYLYFTMSNMTFILKKNEIRRIDCQIGPNGDSCVTITAGETRFYKFTAPANEKELVTEFFYKLTEVFD